MDNPVELPPHASEFHAVAPAAAMLEPQADARVDDFQLSGLGNTLLDILQRSAVARGIDRLSAATPCATTCA